MAQFKFTNIIEVYGCIAHKADFKGGATGWNFQAEKTVSIGLYAYLRKTILNGRAGKKFSICCIPHVPLIVNF